MATSNKNTGSATVALPTAYTREIGRIMVYWAHIEFLLRRATHDAAGIDQKLGRVALMEPKPDSVPEQIRKIFLARRLNPPKFPKDLKKQITELYEWRNALAHGVWIKLKGTRYPVLQYARGTPDPMPHSPGKSVPHKVDPVSYQLTALNLRQMADGYLHYIKVAEGIRAHVKSALIEAPEK